MQERCERRLEIFKQLVEKTTREPHGEDGEDPAKAQVMIQKLLLNLSFAPRI